MHSLAPVPSFRPARFITDPRLDISVVDALTTPERDAFYLLDPPSLERISARAAVTLDDVIRLRHHYEMLLPTSRGWNA